MSLTWLSQDVQEIIIFSASLSPARTQPATEPCFYRISLISHTADSAVVASGPEPGLRTRMVELLTADPVLATLC